MSTSNFLPLLPIRNAVVFPGIALTFLVKRPVGLAALKKAKSFGDIVVLVTQHADSGKDPRPEDLYRVGTMAKIERISGSEEQGYQIVVRGIARYQTHAVTQADGSFITQGEVLSDRQDADTGTINVLFQNLKKLSHEVLELLPSDTSNLSELLDQVDDPTYLSHLAAANLNLPLEQKQELLANVSLKNRLLSLLELMQKQKEMLLLQTEIDQKMSQRLGKLQRDAILREQMKQIQEELGDGTEKDGEDLKARIEAANMPEEVKKIADQELKRLENQGKASPESHVIRNYIDWLCNMPWNKQSEDSLDLDHARKILDEDHSGLDKIKRRIVQHLAVMKLRKQMRGSILCFVGPPGVGKTSLGQSIAKALGRKFVRASLGGVRDDAEIRGHRRTYIGAMPGRIAQGIKRAGENNPVFMLDEIDKLSHGFQGDPASALLEVLDPEQNKTFMDHYLDVPFDLSNVFFVATANSLESIPAPLLDRMEVIHLSGYTLSEKAEIAKKYLIPKQLKEHGLTEADVQFSSEALMEVISHYTREAGVRNLNRHIGALCRVATEKVLRRTVDNKEVVVIDPTWLEDAIGAFRYESEVSEERTPPGVVTGLAWTPHGGDILFIEAQKMPGKGGLILTGQLGEVMKESAQIAMSLVRSRLPAFAPGVEYDKTDVHIHVPSGAIPKDGPSAGIAILSALASLYSGRSISPKLAMTGEITLRGAVLPVGGIKEKIIAAHRAGITHVIMSRRNQKDLKDVPEEVKLGLKIEFVDTAADVFRLALGIENFDLLTSPAIAPALLPRQTASA